MMYRLIQVQRGDEDFQRVLWRQNTSISDEVKHFWFLTVTFGAECALHLAVKRLMQLFKNEDNHQYQSLQEWLVLKLQLN